MLASNGITFILLGMGLSNEYSHQHHLDSNEEYKTAFE